MSKSNEYALEHDNKLKELYSKVEEAVIAIDKVKELEGFQLLRKQHKDIDFDLLKNQTEEFLSLIDDYIRGEY